MWSTLYAQESVRHCKHYALRSQCSWKCMEIDSTGTRKWCWQLWNALFSSHFIFYLSPETLLTRWMSGVSHLTRHSAATEAHSLCTQYVHEPCVYNCVRGACIGYVKCPNLLLIYAWDVLLLAVKKLICNCLGGVPNDFFINNNASTQAFTSDQNNVNVSLLLFVNDDDDDHLLRALVNCI